MVSEILVNFDSSIGVLPDGTNLLLEPMLTSSNVLCRIHLKAIVREVPINSIYKFRYYAICFFFNFLDTEHGALD